MVLGKPVGRQLALEQRLVGLNPRVGCLEAGLDLHVGHLLDHGFELCPQALDLLLELLPPILEVVEPQRFCCSLGQGLLRRVEVFEVDGTVDLVDQGLGFVDAQASRKVVVQGFLQGFRVRETDLEPQFGVDTEFPRLRLLELDERRRARHAAEDQPVVVGSADREADLRPESGLECRDTIDAEGLVEGLYGRREDVAPAELGRKGEGAVDEIGQGVPVG